MRSRWSVAGGGGALHSRIFRTKSTVVQNRDARSIVLARTTGVQGGGGSRTRTAVVQGGEANIAITRC